jgi:transposase-like protein
MICPRCEQGDIYEAKIKGGKIIIYICEECEATWFDFTDIENKKWVDYGTYMEGKGLPPLWSELSELRKL